MTNLGNESETVEFKEGIAQLDKGTKALSAMLNMHHNGCVYFGVNDAGDVIGVDVGDSTLEKIRNAVRTDIAPEVIPEIETLVSDDGRNYVRVSVLGHNVPYSCRERYYVRNVTSNVSASPDVVAQIVLSRGMDPLRDMQSDDQDLTFEYLFTSLLSHGFHPRSDKNYFRSVGLLDDRGVFNLNAYLLSDQNQLPVQVVEFKGTDRADMSNRRDFGRCSLLKSMESVSEYISGLMEVRVDTDDLERRETSLFDAGAFREAWVNACVHNAWRTYTPPSVLVFDDRLEIVSYGRIPFPLSDEGFFTGDSRPVNSGLFGIFAKLNKIEQSGHGVPRIVKSYGRESFRITESGVKVTMPFGFTPRFVEMRRSNDSARQGLPKESLEVLRYLERNPGAKLSEVSENVSITLSSVKKIVTSLKSKGLLRNEGTNRNSRWVLT